MKIFIRSDNFRLFNVRITTLMNRTDENDN